MRIVQIHNRTRPLQTELLAKYCDTFVCRLRGLTFRRGLPNGEGLLLVMGRSSRLDSAIHMLGVGFDIGVVWLDDLLRVVDGKLARSWRPLYVPKRPARYVLEIVPGRLAEFLPGDEVTLEEHKPV
jgi:uncharacterized membrane protein (UPF0127 family)